MIDTIKEATGRWPEILEQLGVDTKYLKNVHGPCPICKGGEDRFRFDDKMNGNWICNQCGAGGGFGLLKGIYGWDFGTAAAKIDRVLGAMPDMPRAATTERSLADKCRAICRVLGGARGLDGTDPASTYLRGRGADPGAIPADLRVHAGLRHSLEGGVWPAMLGIMRYPDGKVSSVHRTYLTKEGNKAPVDPIRKIMQGKPLKGSCVRLSNIFSDIGIAEGIETAISATNLFKIPCWAAISANGLQTWEPPIGIHSVTIFGDNDINFVGQEAAFILAKRLNRMGISVTVKIPETSGQDWNDYCMARHQQEPEF